MKSKSIKGKTAKEVRTALETSMTDGFSPTIAIVFIGNDNEREAICSLFSEKQIKIAGSSTGSNFIDGEIESDCIVILLLAINKAYFKVQLVSSPTQNTKEKAIQISQAGVAAFRKPAFLLMSGGIATDGDEIIEGVEHVCKQGTTIFGGLAADNFKMERTYVFSNEELTDNGLLALIFDEEKITLSGVAIGGWKPMGIERTITSSRGNIVYTIDNEPALDFISRYAGIKNIDAQNGLGILLSSNFQLQLKRDNKHPVMRTPMKASKEDRSILFAGSLPQGSKVRLCLLPGFEVIEETLNEFVQYKNVQPQADALIMFSCAGRQMALGPYVSEEISSVKNIWKAPMAGFFCFGEIGRVAQGVHEFHNMTCSLAILKEN